MQEFRRKFEIPLLDIASSRRQQTTHVADAELGPSFSGLFFNAKRESYTHVQLGRARKRQSVKQGRMGLVSTQFLLLSQLLKIPRQVRSLWLERSLFDELLNRGVY
jgi:hypothetical protein